jgi:hypothetical protein
VENPQNSFRGVCDAYCSIISAMLFRDDEAFALHSTFLVNGRRSFSEISIPSAVMSNFGQGS